MSGRAGGLAWIHPKDPGSPAPPKGGFSLTHRIVRVPNSPCDERRIRDAGVTVKEKRLSGRYRDATDVTSLLGQDALVPTSHSAANDPSSVRGTPRPGLSGARARLMPPGEPGDTACVSTPRASAGRISTAPCDHAVRTSAAHRYDRSPGPQSPGARSPGTSYRGAGRRALGAAKRAKCPLSNPVLGRPSRIDRSTLDKALFSPAKCRNRASPVVVVAGRPAWDRPTRLNASLTCVESRTFMAHHVHR